LKNRRNIRNARRKAVPFLIVGKRAMDRGLYFALTLLMHSKKYLRLLIGEGIKGRG